MATGKALIKIVSSSYQRERDTHTQRQRETERQRDRGSKENVIYFGLYES